MTETTVKPKFKMGELVEFKNVFDDPYYLNHKIKMSYFVQGIKSTQILFDNYGKISEMKYWEYILLEESDLDILDGTPLDPTYLTSAQEDLLTLTEQQP